MRQSTKHPPLAGAAPDFVHLTLDSGHSVIQKSFSPHPLALAALMPQRGDSVLRHVPVPTNRYSVLATGDRNSGCFSVWKDEVLPLVLCTYCTDENRSTELFSKAVATYRRVLEDGVAFVDGAVLLKQPSAPWLAVQLLPGLAVDPASTVWLGDLERCLFYRLTQFDH